MTNLHGIAATAMALALLGAVPAELAAQEGNAMLHGGRGGASGPKPHLIDIPVLRKTCPFPVATLPQGLFNLMECETVVVPTGFIGKGSPPMQIVVMNYSHRGKTGGIVRVFEAPESKTFTPTQIVTRVIESRIFRDHGIAPMHPLIIHGAIVCPMALSTDGLEDAVRALQH